MTERTPDLDVVVLGGGGHVGLPLSLAFAKAGLRVGIYDTNQATLDRIAAGEMPFMETGADDLLREILPTGRLAFGSDGTMIERTDNLVVVIGTPVDEFLGPSMTIFEKAVDQISPHLRDGALVALRSTVYPGTTGYVAQHLAERGCRVDVAFCPERIAEGHALEELHSLPQIIGADDDRAADRATELFGTLAGKTIRTTTKEAELAKLFTNTWRYMKFAVANQFFMIADQAGVDYTNILRAIREDYPRAADLPGPGFAAGPCLFKDTMQLSAFTADHFPLGPGRDAGQRGPARLHRVRTGAPLRRPQRQDGRDPWDGLQGRIGRPARVAQLQVAQAPVVGRCPRPRHRPVRGRRPPGQPRLRPQGERYPGPRRTAQALSKPPGRRQGRGRRVGGPRRGDQALVRILVTGAAGFINGYLVPELLEAGHEVIGLDDFSKYGRLVKSYDDHPRYRFVEGDAKDAALVGRLAADCDQVVAAAAMIGGISYFHEFAYDLLAENERILASTFDGAIAAHRDGHLERIIVVSSSMVYESATIFPTPEGAQLTSPPPISTYGFQKLASEYFAKGAWEQYKLPYTIVRPFNCVGIGERRAVRDTDIMSGNVKLALSHVVPDLVHKILKGQDPLHILGAGDQVRHYTYGGDLAHGIRLAMESPAAVNDDFNLSTAASTTVLELAETIWHKIHTDGRPFHFVSDAPFEHDVQLRVPDVRKAREILGFDAATTLDQMLDEVIPWIRVESDAGRL